MANGTFQRGKQLLPARGEVLLVRVCQDLPPVAAPENE